MAKFYRGNIPPPDSGWDQLAKIESDGAEWLAYRKQQEHDPAWVNFKLVANGRIQGKANYWIVRNVKTGQIAFARDALLLRNNRPELNREFESVISTIADSVILNGELN